MFFALALNLKAQKVILLFQVVKMRPVTSKRAVYSSFEVGMCRVESEYSAE